jgi:hypothetical protein
LEKDGAGSAQDRREERPMSNFAIYMTGVLLVVGALMYGASLMGMEARWIAIGAAVLAGLGIMGAIVKTRRPESPNP